MAYGYIYRIANVVNGKVYIWQSTNVQKRLFTHKKELLENKHYNVYLQNSFNKYGEDNFVFEVIDEANEKYALDYLECFWIAAYGGANSSMTYNLRNGGCGGELSDKAKQKLSEAFSGENNPCWGRKHTKEECRKMSENHADFSKENHPQWGTHRPEDAKKKQSEKMRGRQSSFLGKHHTEESKRKNSEAHKGKRASDETRIKQSESQKARWTDDMREEWGQKLSGANNPHARAVICLETKEIFATIKMAEEWLGKTGITTCCKGYTKTCGKHHWMYYDEYLNNPSIEGGETNF